MVNPRDIAGERRRRRRKMVNPRDIAGERRRRRRKMVNPRDIAGERRRRRKMVNPRDIAGERRRRRRRSIVVVADTEFVLLLVTLYLDCTVVEDVFDYADVADRTFDCIVVIAVCLGDVVTDCCSCCYC